MGSIPRAAVAAALTALVLSGCAACGAPATGTGTDRGPVTPSSGDTTPCDSGFIADMVPDFEGQASAEEALEAWLSGTETGTPRPAAVPTDGWSDENPDVAGPRTFVSADWRATAQQSTRGQWRITELECVTTSEDAGPG